MGSSKKQTTTNTYGTVSPGSSPDIDAARARIGELKGKINPMIRGQYAGARRDLDNQFLNPLGGATTAAMRDATLQAGREDLGQQEAQAIGGAEFAADNADFERTLAVAGLTAPRVVQTGGTMTQSGGFLQDLLMGGIAGGAQIGSAAIM